MSKKHIDAHDGKLGKGKTLNLNEVGDPGPIEKVAETEFHKKAIELEAFMNEYITVVVHSDTNDNAVEMPLVTVGQLNQGFIRGQNQKVKRKYVEALARGRITKYTQKTPDPMRPENIQMEERTALVYPFTVVDDPNPIGREWLENILAQP